ncbi:MAG: ferredoxin [Mariprofundales bacterium]|nr:ferredoxin [Mariprofundales bacterium]
MSQRPSIANYQRHAILCAGRCCDEEGSRSLLHYMKDLLRSLGVGVDRVRLNRAGCLGVCREGAIMLVYPEAVWYCGVDQAGVDRIVREHLLGGEVVEDLLFHRNQFDQSEGVEA